MKKLLFAIVVLLCAGSLSAQTDTAIINHKDSIPHLIVGYKISPPFTMKDNAGQCKGVSVELWQNIAQNMGVTYEFKEYNLIDLLEAIRLGKVDVCISPLTVTSERLSKVSFTQPFYTSNLAIAVSKTTSNEVFKFLRNFFSLNFFRAVLFLFVVILIFGTIIWLVEKRQNPTRFGKGWRGVGHGVWWSAVTMTTVGYGDKIPTTTVGRLLAVIWMFTSIIVISSLTGSIAASLTVQSSHHSISTINDLKNVRTTTIAGSNSEKVLLSRGINYITKDTIENVLYDIIDSKTDAFLYDEPIIRYLFQYNHFDKDIDIISQKNNSQYYSFSMPKKHPIHDTLNILLLRELESLQWKAILNEYYIGE